MNIEDRVLRLSLAPSAHGEVDISAVQGALTAALGDGYRISNHEDGVELVSFHSSLGILLQPGRITVSDYSSALEPRTEFMAVVAVLQELLRDHELQPRFREWNVEGVVSDVEQIAPMGRLFDVEWVDRVIGGDTEPTWMAEELKLTSTSTFSDWLDVSLHWISSIRGVAELKFQVTGTILEPGTRQATDLLLEGSAVQTGASAIIDRLFEESMG